MPQRRASNPLETIGILKRIAKPGVTAASTYRYAPRWYAQSVEYDVAGRPVTESTCPSFDTVASACAASVGMTEL